MSMTPNPQRPTAQNVHRLAQVEGHLGTIELLHQVNDQILHIAVENGVPHEHITPILRTLDESRRLARVAARAVQTVLDEIVPP